MASLHATKSGVWNLHFRYGGRQFCRSTGTTIRKLAEAQRHAVAETIRLMGLGGFPMPAEADPATWIMSRGVLASKPKLEAPALARLKDICDAYIAAAVRKATRTLEGEQTHCKHFCEVFGESANLAGFNLSRMQQYVNARQKTIYRGKLVGGSTVRKELVTFSQVWAYARKFGYVKGRCPLKDDTGKNQIDLPKEADREPFRTWAEITDRIEMGGLKAEQEQELWATVFLDIKQVSELLSYVKANATAPHILPAFALAALGGIRRSEIVRSERIDIDLDNAVMLVKERKKLKGKSESKRRLDLAPHLVAILRDWFMVHPGGPMTICTAKGKNYTNTNASEDFRATVDSGKWSVLRGYHTLRHSFGANCHRAGVPREQIAKWMGHTTQQMMNLYQHLFSQDGQAYADRLRLADDWEQTVLTVTKTAFGRITAADVYAT